MVSPKGSATFLSVITDMTVVGHCIVTTVGVTERSKREEMQKENVISEPRGNVWFTVELGHSLE